MTYMYDEWDEMAPDSGDNDISVWEAICDAVAVLAEALAALLLVALIMGLIAYSIWREYAIYSFLAG